MERASLQADAFVLLSQAAQGFASFESRIFADGEGFVKMVRPISAINTLTGAGCFSVAPAGTGTTASQSGSREIPRLPYAARRLVVHGLPCRAIPSAVVAIAMGTDAAPAYLYLILEK